MLLIAKTVQNQFATFVQNYYLEIGIIGTTVQTAKLYCVCLS